MGSARLVGHEGVLEMRGYAKFVEHFSKWILLAVFIVTLAAIPGLTKLRVIAEPSENNVSRTNAFIQSVQELKRVFGGSANIVLVDVEALHGREVTDPKALEKIQKVSDILRGLSLVQRDSVLSLTTATDLVDGPDGLESKRLVESIPTTHFEEKELKTRIRANGLIQGRLVSHDLKHALIVATATDKASVNEIREQVSQALRPLVEGSDGTKDDGYPVQLGGDGEVNYQLESGIQHDTAIFVLIALFLIMISFYFMFKTWKGVVLPFSATLIAIIWTMGAIGYYGEPISILIAMLPVLLVVTGSAYSIHVFHHLQEYDFESQRAQRFSVMFRGVLKRMISPLSVSAVTTLIGGISLLSFRLKTIQNFGVAMALGTVVSFAVSILLVPALYQALRNPIRRLEDSIQAGVKSGVSAVSQLALSTVQNIPVAGPVTGALAESVGQGVSQGWKGFWRGLNLESLLTRSLRWAARVVLHHPIWVIVVFAVGSGVAYTQIHKIQIQFNNVDMLPKNYPIRDLMTRLDNAFNGLQDLDVMVDAQAPQGTLEPEFLAKLDEFERRVNDIPTITRSFSVLDLYRRVDGAINPKGHGEATSLPKSRDTASQYLFLIESSSAGKALGGLITPARDKVKLKFTTNRTDTRSVTWSHEAIQSAARQIFGSSATVTVGGNLVTMAGIIQYIVWGKIQNILISILTILVLASLMYRSISRGLISIATLPVGVVANFGLMGWLGIELNGVTAIITSLAAGMGVDFSIHLISAIKTEYAESRDFERSIERAITGPGRAVVYNAASTLIGFSALLFSNFSAIHTFALLICFNMAVLAIGALTLVPALIRVSAPDFVTGYIRRTAMIQNRWAVAGKAAVFALISLGLLTGIMITDAKAGSGELDAKALLKKSMKAVYAKSEEATFIMKLVDAQGAVNARKMKVWFRSDTEDTAKLLIKFTEPADIRGTGFLTIAQPGQAPDQWLYLPAIKKSRRIKGGNSDEPFLGSEFSMADLSADKQDSLVYAVEGSKKIDGIDCHQVVGSAQPGTNVADLTYSKKIYFVRKDNHLIPRAEFYNPTGSLEKVMTLQKSHEEGGRWLADVIEMKNVVTGKSTVLEIAERNSKKVPGDHIFSVSNLER